MICDGLRFSFERFAHRSTGLRCKKDFKFVTTVNFYRFQGGRTILNEFKGFTTFLTQMYPFQWTLSDIERVSNQYWDHLQNQKHYLEFISQKIPITIERTLDWAHTQSVVIQEYDGSTLLHRYSSIFQVLERFFPEYFWDKWLGTFPRMTEFEEKRMFLDLFVLKYLGEVETHLHLKQVKEHCLKKQPGGPTLLNYNNGSPQAIFCSVYPEFAPQRVHRGYWKTYRQSYLIERTMKMFDLRKKEDWYRLSISQFSQIYGKLVSKMKLIRLLETLQPEEDWAHFRFSEKINKKSRQKFLGIRLRELFSDVEILEEFKFSLNGQVLLFDYYIPKLGVVIEYQGEQHYYNVLRWASLETQKVRDHLKHTICASNGLKIIYIPYWWDNSISSLKTITLPQIHKS